MSPSSHENVEKRLRRGGTTQSTTKQITGDSTNLNLTKTISRKRNGREQKTRRKMFDFFYSTKK